MLMVRDHDTPVATVTLDETPDLGLWLPEEDPTDALYVHRLVVSRKAAGQDLGSAILDWAGQQANKEGKHWLRLDAWSSNPDLHRYYLEHGFQFVRTVAAEDVVSGVLLQRRAKVILDRGPSIRDAAG